MKSPRSGWLDVSGSLSKKGFLFVFSILIFTPIYYAKVTASQLLLKEVIQNIQGQFCSKVVLHTWREGSLDSKLLLYPISSQLEVHKLLNK